MGTTCSTDSSPPSMSSRISFPVDVPRAPSSASSLLAQPTWVPVCEHPCTFSSRNLRLTAPTQRPRKSVCHSDLAFVVLAANTLPSALTVPLTFHQRDDSVSVRRRLHALCTRVRSRSGRRRTVLNCVSYLFVKY